MRIALVNTRIAERFSEIECTYDQLPPVTALPLLACETERRLHRKNASCRQDVVSLCIIW